jgi:hypothetical protein
MGERLGRGFSFPLTPNPSPPYRGRGEKKRLSFPASEAVNSAVVLGAVGEWEGHGKMADDFAFDEINHVFGDVGGVVGDAL